jgi:hypothetical protein
MRFFFPYTPWAGILRKVPFPYATPYFLCVPFFFFFFLQAAKLNYVRFEDCFCFLLLDRLYNTCFVRLSVESFLVCNNVAAFLYGWRSASGSLPFIFFSSSVAGSESMF